MKIRVLLAIKCSGVEVIQAVQQGERDNMSIDADPQQQEAASPLMLVVRSSSR